MFRAGGTEYGSCDAILTVWQEENRKGNTVM